MADADSVIIPCTLVTAGVMIAYEFAPKSVGGQGEFPPAKLLLGLGVTTMGLAMMGQFAPGVAKMLAVTVAVSAVMYRGVPIAEKYFASPTPEKVK
ncbi:MAG TPA: hypothetical protein VM715_17295 [Candidatus Acidoferrum sp.]|nr:hypothetical protein [Candidatus Acidoferrum sp.]